MMYRVVIKNILGLFHFESSTGGGAMYIKWMHIENYRNLADVTLSFHNDINYFVGENAVGKSNF